MIEKRSRSWGLWFLLFVNLTVGWARADVVTYFHNDISGTPMAATDAAGNLLWKEAYRPYGERLLNPAGPDGNRLWFGGKAQDPDTGLSYLGARYYNPQLGRFTGVDPKEVDPEDPHSFNRYAYANNNPYKYVDPDGKNPLIVFAIARLAVQRLVTFALTRGAQAALTASEVAAGDALGGASLAAGATASTKAIEIAGEKLGQRGLQAIKITDKGIARIENHLTKTPSIEPGPAEFLMIERLKAGNKTLQDLRFYQHEIIESRMIDKTRNLYDDSVDAARYAHHRTLIKQGLYYKGYEKDLYHPDAMKAGGY